MDRDRHSASMQVKHQMCTLSGQLWCGPPGCKSLGEELSSIRPWLPDTSFRKRTAASSHHACKRASSACYHVLSHGMSVGGLSQPSAVRQAAPQICLATQLQNKATQ